MPKTIKENSKAIKIQKQLEKIIRRALTDGEEVVFSRIQLAKKFNCNPALISYVLSKINAKHTMTIESKRGINGYIKIKPYSHDIKEIIVPKTITAKRKEEIEYSVKNISDLYFENLLTRLPSDFILNPAVLKLVFNTICSTVLAEGEKATDVRILFLIQIAIENALAEYTRGEDEDIKKAPSPISEENREDAITSEL